MEGVKKSFYSALVQHLCQPFQINCTKPDLVVSCVSRSANLQDTVGGINSRKYNTYFQTYFGRFGVFLAGIFDTFTLAESAELTFGYVLAEEEERQNQRSLRFQLFQVDIFDAVNIKSDSTGNCKF